MQAKATVNTGNFSVTISGDLKDEVVQKKISEGLVYDLQRGGLTKAYIALGGVKNEKGNLRLPDGFERSQVKYDEASRQAMVDAITAWSKDMFNGTPEIGVGQYEGGDAATPQKRATALVDAFLGTGEEKAYRTILGLPRGTREELIAEAHKRGLGIQPPKAPKAATTEETAPAEEAAA